MRFTDKWVCCLHLDDSGTFEICVVVVVVVLALSGVHHPGRLAELTNLWGLAESHCDLVIDACFGAIDTDVNSSLNSIYPARSAVA